METYGGWTVEQIQEAEQNGDYIPDNVWIAYVNGDADGG